MEHQCNLDQHVSTPKFLIEEPPLLSWWTAEAFPQLSDSFTYNVKLPSLQQQKCQQAFCCLSNVTNINLWKKYKCVCMYGKGHQHIFVSLASDPIFVVNVGYCVTQVFWPSGTKIENKSKSLTSMSFSLPVIQCQQSAEQVHISLSNSRRQRYLEPWPLSVVVCLSQLSVVSSYWSLLKYHLLREPFPIHDI